MAYHLSPLRYPGGKNCIFSFVSELFYENKLIGINYAEPYAGGAGLALRLLMEEYVANIYINDFDRAIYAFWFAILNRKDEFCQWIDSVDISVESWRYYKKIQNEFLLSDLFDLAKSTFFLNRTNISGVIKGGIIGGYEQIGKYKINARFNKNNLIDKIENIYKFKDRIFISNLDGIDFVNKINHRRNNFFIYLDPPYYQKGANLYMNFYTEKDHQNLSKYIHTLNSNWMVSYDNHEFILNLYAGDAKIVHCLSQSTSNRKGNEILIFSKSVVFQNSVNKLLSPLQI